MARITHVLFDLGNTLLYFDGDWPSVFMEAQKSLLAQLRASNLALDGPAFLADYGNRLEAYYTERESEFVYPAGDPGSSRSAGPARDRSTQSIKSDVCRIPGPLAARSGDPSDAAEAPRARVPVRDHL